MTKNKKDIQIILPLTGYGSRFRSAGYKRLKPFIEIHGKPMIEWVVKMFEGEEANIVFVCRKEHLDTLDYVEPELRRIAPQARIFQISDWQKEGPVVDILKASSYIDDHLPVLVSYCDYYMHWNYRKFKQEVFKGNWEGAIPCYSGFHPHLLYKENVYASCRVNAVYELLEIREKFSFAEDPTKALHSPGMYYMKSGKLLKKYYRKLVEDQCSLKGEYYASLPYNLLVGDGLKVWCPVNVDYFCQWGTPQDLEEYLFWINGMNAWGEL